MKKPGKKPESVFDRIARNPEKFVVYSGEAMLADYDAETVKLWLADHGEQSPVQGHKKSPDSPDKGSRYLMVLIEINDEQQPIDIHIRDRMMDVMKETIKPLTTPDKVVKQAGILCRDSDFHKFVHSQIKGFNDDQKAAFILSGIPRWLTDMGLGSFKVPEQAAEWCKFYLYYRCGVNSRSQLGFKKEYREKFNFVLRDFNRWGSSNGANRQVHSAGGPAGARAEQPERGPRQGAAGTGSDHAGTGGRGNGAGPSNKG